jgi:pyrophosphatase PpaX
MPRRAVLFDLDGTLLDSIALILASYHHTLEGFGVPRPADAEIIALLGMPLEACFATWASEERPIPALVERYREHNLAMHDAMVQPYPGVSELDTPRGKPDPAPVLLALERLGVAASDAVFVGDSTHDVVAGNAAGVETIAVLWGPFARAQLEAAKPTAMASSAAELERLLLG